MDSVLYGSRTRTRSRSRARSQSMTQQERAERTYLPFGEDVTRLISSTPKAILVPWMMDHLFPGDGFMTRAELNKQPLRDLKSHSLLRMSMVLGTPENTSAAFSDLIQRHVVFNIKKSSDRVSVGDTGSYQFVPLRTRLSTTNQASPVYRFTVLQVTDGGRVLWTMGKSRLKWRDEKKTYWPQVYDVDGAKRAWTWWNPFSTHQKLVMAFDKNVRGSPPRPTVTKTKNV